MTTLLDPEQASREELASLYRARRNNEVEYRRLKQTLNHAKLRCRNGQRLLIELDWCILGLAVAELFALKEQLAERALRAGPDLPGKRSLAQTVRALRWYMRSFHQSSPTSPSLAKRLRAAVTDDYQRRSSKRARYRPPNPDKRPLGDPKLHVLTAIEQKKLQQLELAIAP